MKELFIFISIVLLFGCANLSTPTGGPEDEAPPKLTRSIPEQGQTNFTGKRLEFTFDELVRLSNPSDEILISPSPGKLNFSARGTRVIIESENEWEKNTTYSISFREGVVDVTESNPAENLQVAFSTGTYIDSLSISGSLTESLSEKIPQNIMVAVYASDTFNIFNHSPSYFTRSGTDGKFRLENLKQGSYYLYAFDDRNKNLRVESASERFGFLTAPLTLESSTDSITIPIARIDSRLLTLNTIRHTESTSTLYFNKSLTAITISPDSVFIVSLNKGQNEVTLFHTVDFQDSIKIEITAIDSLNQTLDSTLYAKKNTTRYQPETFALTTDQPGISSQSIFTVQGTFTKPITNINTDSLYINVDSTRTITFDRSEITIDNILKKFSIQKKIEPSLAAESKLPTLTMGNGLFIALDGDSSIEDKKNIRLVRAEQTGTLLVQVSSNATHFIVQLLNSSNMVVQSKIDSKSFLFHDISPGDYKLRLLIDQNNNGRWDPANYFSHSSPEPQVYYKSPEGTFTIPIRANFELGPYVLTF